MTSVLPTLHPTPPSFVRKPASWTFCADFYPKRCSDIAGGVFYELSAKTAKEFSRPFHTHILLTVKRFWELMGCDLVCIHGIKLLTWNWNPVPFKEQAWKPGKTQRSWRKLCREMWNRMDLEIWIATAGEEWQSSRELTSYKGNTSFLQRC